MAFETPITIAKALDKINDEFLLPGIQREFVWNTDQIAWLFDSLMRGYPISSFLFWRVDRDLVKNHKFYNFLSNYRERFNTHNEPARIDDKPKFIAILDGQQRLTSLNIALKGSYAYKTAKLHWIDNQKNIPTRQFYLNLSRELKVDEEEDGRRYEFDFLTDADTKGQDIYIDDDRHQWFRVGKILALEDTRDFRKFVRDNRMNENEEDILGKLKEKIIKDSVINYYLVEEQDLNKALNIFIRINSGGKPLDMSDLIMSVVVSKWEKKDARKLINELVDNIKGNDIGFSIEKDFILRTYLYLYNRDIKFVVTNFSKTVKDFEENWEKISECITNTFQLVKSFGYNDERLVSKNALIPIVYYLYHRNIHENFKDREGETFENDRKIIKKWLNVILLRQALGRDSNTVLRQSREAFTNDSEMNTKISSEIAEFPANVINSKIKRALSVDDDFIEELLMTQKDNKYAFAILALLFPNLDYKNNDFDKDHMHPISAFENDADNKIKKELYNSIINLQMLGSNENRSKSDDPLKVWFAEQEKKKQFANLHERYIIPKEASLEFADAADFFDERKKLLSEKLRNILT